VLLAACGASSDVLENAKPDDITIGQRCGQVEVEQGDAGTCATFAETLAHYADVYVARWGAPSGFDSWTIRVRTTTISGAPSPDITVAGTTYYATRTIDVSTHSLVVLPHEMRHVALGPTSKDHHGWCDEFSGWEIEALMFDERMYLGCSTSGMPRARYLGAQSQGRVFGTAELREPGRGL
jgi:hypothetical protein